jgi:hypothetical protein
MWLQQLRNFRGLLKVFAVCICCTESLCYKQAAAAEAAQLHQQQQAATTLTAA